MLRHIRFVRVKSLIRQHMTHLSQALLCIHIVTHVRHIEVNRSLRIGLQHIASHGTSTKISECWSSSTSSIELLLAIINHVRVLEVKYATMLPWCDLYLLTSFIPAARLSWLLRCLSVSAIVTTCRCIRTMWYLTQRNIGVQSLILRICRIANIVIVSTSCNLGHNLQKHLCFRVRLPSRLRPVLQRHRSTARFLGEHLATRGIHAERTTIGIMIG